MKKPEKAAPKGQPALKIAIVGTASTSVGDAPYSDESWKIWTLGANYINSTRYDVWFELHTKSVLKNANAYNRDRVAFLKSCGDKLIIGHPNDDFPEARLYPWDEIIGRFGRYLTSSLSEMIALAIHAGATEIGLWGVDMVCQDEYGYQKPSCEYFLGIAQAMGIKIFIADESPILRPTRVYGLEDQGFCAEIISRQAQLKSMIAEERRKLKDIGGMEAQLFLLNDLAARWG